MTFSGLKEHRSFRHVSCAAVLLVLHLAAAGCGGSGDSATDPVSTSDVAFTAATPVAKATTNGQGEARITTATLGATFEILAVDENGNRLQGIALDYFEMGDQSVIHIFDPSGAHVDGFIMGSPADIDASQVTSTATARSSNVSLVRTSGGAYPGGLLRPAPASPRLVPIILGFAVVLTAVVSATLAELDYITNAYETRVFYVTDRALQGLGWQINCKTWDEIAAFMNARISAALDLVSILVSFVGASGVSAAEVSGTSLVLGGKAAEQLGSLTASKIRGLLLKKAVHDWGEAMTSLESRDIAVQVFEPPAGVLGSLRATFASYAIYQDHPVCRPPSGDISGTVVSASTAAPISGALVSLDTGGASTTTNAEGQFAFSSVSVGSHVVSVSRQGYASASRTLTVTESPLIVNFALTPQASGGLVARYTFDGNARDTSGSGLDGTPYNVTSATDRFGVAGRAYSFNGTSSRVDVLDDPRLRFSSSSSFSVAVWVKFEDLSRAQMLVTKYSDPAGSFVWAMGFEPPSPWFLVSQQWAGPNYVAFAQSAVTAGRWYYLVGTYDGHTARMYLDGVLQQEVEYLGGVAETDPLMALRFGNQRVNEDGYTDTVWFNGAMDDASIYSRALSGAEVAALFAAGTPTPACVSPPGGMVAWWRGDGSATDSIGGRTGSLEGGARYSAGLVSSAFQLDGVEGTRVRAPATGLPTAQGPRTVEFWSRLGSDPDGDAQGFGYGSEGPGLGFYVFTAHPPAGTLTFSRHDVSGPCSTSSLEGDCQVVTSVDLRDDRWHHVAATYDGTTVRLFADGVLAGERAQLLNTGTSGGACIGARCAAEAFQLGQIDEVSVYDRALSPAEIGSIVAAGAAGKCR
jgi:hypothetical protein